MNIIADGFYDQEVTDELYNKVLEKTVIKSQDECWEWLGGSSIAIQIKRKSYSLSRIMYRRFIGIIPQDQRVVRCKKNFRCINPYHIGLEPHVMRENEKWCSKCKTFKDFSEFGASNNSSIPYQSYCKKCISGYGAKWEKNKRKDRRPGYLEKSYKMTPEDYQVLYENQEGKCMICNEYKEKLHIDHCHKTGIVRGLLCPNCNKMIGLAYDNPVTLLSAASYVQRVS